VAFLLPGSAPVGFEDMVGWVGLAGEVGVQTSESWLEILGTCNPCSFLIHQIKACMLAMSCAKDDGVLI
jgi:hypothetical protein